MSTVVTVVSSLFLAYFIALDLVYASLFAVSFYQSGVHMRRRALGGDDVVLRSPLTPPMSIVLPAYNEEACIVASVDAARLLEYPELGMEAVWKIEVVDFPAFIVVDDKGNDFFQEVRDHAKAQPVALSR